MVRDWYASRYRTHGRSIPIHLRKTAEAAGIVLRSVQHVTVGHQVRVRADGPRVNHTPFHIEQIRRAAHAEPGVAGVGVGFVPIQQLGWPLQRLVGVKRTGGKAGQPTKPDRHRMHFHIHQYG